MPAHIWLHIRTGQIPRLATLTAMKSFLARLAFLLCAAAAFLPPAGAQARPYDAPQLESLLAPIALQPDEVLWQVLAAAVAPPEVAARILAPYPELHERMLESPQWTRDLADAYRAQPDDVLAAVQVLRQRAEASGHLRDDEYQSVRHEGPVIAIAPVVSHVHYVRYYDPLVVYGPLWRPARRPVHFRPWQARPVVVHRPVAQHRHHERRVEHHRPAPRNGPPSPAARMQQQQGDAYRARARENGLPSRAREMQTGQYRRVPESQRQPIVRSR